MDGRRPKNGVRSACRLGGRTVVPGKYDLLVRARVKWGEEKRGHCVTAVLGAFPRFWAPRIFGSTFPRLCH